ncbi:MAG: SDR family oxidoreductase [Bacteroidia bacterium]
MKNIVITGASKGLGYALAKTFIEDGNVVYNLSRTLCDLPGVNNISTDFLNLSSVENAASELISRIGSIDVLINNAGILGSRVSIKDYDLKEWKDVFTVNIHSVFYLTKLLLSSISSGGKIINVSSGLGVSGRAQWGAYSASKFALEGLSQILAEELKPQNIQVYIVDPGGINTELRNKAFPEEDRSRLAEPSTRVDVFRHLVYSAEDKITATRYHAGEFFKSMKGSL